jgi:hypothetical protein
MIIANPFDSIVYIQPETWNSTNENGCSGWRYVKRLILIDFSSTEKCGGIIHIKYITTSTVPRFESYIFILDTFYATQHGFTILLKETIKILNIRAMYKTKYKVIRERLPMKISLYATQNTRT